MAKLNEKQLRFIAEYLIDLNATKAAKRAGYSEKTASVQGFDLLRKPEIQAELEAAISARAERTQITADRVLKELGRIAFFDPRKLLNSDGSPKPLEELDDDTAGAIGGLDVLEEYEGTGKDRVFVGYVKKYKISDKNAAITNAMRHLGMLRDKVEHSGPGGDPLPAAQVVPVFNVTVKGK